MFQHCRVFLIHVQIFHLTLKISWECLNMNCILSLVVFILLHTKPPFHMQSPQVSCSHSHNDHQVKTSSINPHQKQPTVYLCPVLFIYLLAVYSWLVKLAHENCRKLITYGCPPQAGARCQQHPHRSCHGLRSCLPSS